MSATIPDSHKDLLEGPVHVSLATVMPDGQPQVTVVWCNYDGEHVLVNTARGRQKDENMRQRPQVTVLAVDPEDPYRWIEVRGTVEEMTEEGAVEHIDELARLYKNVPEYYGYSAPTARQNQETRVKIKIRPIHVNASGS